MCTYKLQLNLQLGDSKANLFIKGKWPYLVKYYTLLYKGSKLYKDYTIHTVYFKVKIILNECHYRLHKDAKFKIMPKSTFYLVSLDEWLATQVKKVQTLTLYIKICWWNQRALFISLIKTGKWLILGSNKTLRYGNTTWYGLSCKENEIFYFVK